MNKKTFGIIGAVVLVILLLIASGITPKEKEKKLTENTSEILANAQQESAEYKNSKEQKELTEINVDTYLNYYSGEKDKIILLARPTCQYCQIAEPIIRKIAYEYNLEINYLNTDNFQEDDTQRFVQSDEKFSSGFGTPILFIVSNNKIKDSSDGLTDYAHYKKFFKDNKMIK